MAALSPHAACGGYGKGKMAQRSKLCEAIANQQFWAPQVSFPQGSFLNKITECQIKYAGVVELANTIDLGSIGEILAGSSPVTRTNNERVTSVALLLFCEKGKKDLNLPSSKPNTIGRSRSEYYRKIRYRFQPTSFFLC